MTGVRQRRAGQPRARWNEVDWGFADMITYASRGTTLRAGDVIGSGTVATGCLFEHFADRPAGFRGWLQPGDEVTAAGGPARRAPPARRRRGEGRAAVLGVLTCRPSAPCTSARSAGSGTARRSPSAGHVTTYAELVDAADRLAHVLVAAGVSPGTPVAIMMANRTEWVVADQAVIRAGGAKVPVNDMLSGREIEFVLRDSGAVVALADEKLAPAARAAGVPLVIEVGPEWDAALAGAPAGGPPAVAVGEDDVGLILYTGGTTGRQKGVVHTQRGLAINLLAHIIEMGLADDERLLLTLTAAALGRVPRPGRAAQGGPTTCCERRFDADTRPRPDRSVTASTFLFMVPTMIYRLLDARRGTGRRRLLAAHGPLRRRTDHPGTPAAGAATARAGLHAALRPVRGTELPYPAHPRGPRP